MIIEKRRSEILVMLKNSEIPITGTEMAKAFTVSRQVIVQDIAVLRAQGYNILATSSGYLIPNEREKDLRKVTFLCKHEGYENMEEELRIIIDAGAKVLDVMVEHPVYGKISRPLVIQSRIELQEFIESVKENKAEPLSSLTGGEHLHTIEVPNKKAHKIIVEALKEKGYLVKEL